MSLSKLGRSALKFIRPKRSDSQKGNRRLSGRLFVSSCLNSSTQDVTPAFEPNKTAPLDDVHVVGIGVG